MQFPNRIRAALQKTIPFSSPSGPPVGRIQYASTTGYVRSFKKWICFRPLRGRLWGVFDTPLQPGTCDPSKKGYVFVPFGAVCGAYSIRLYNRLRAILRNTDAIPQPGTYCPSKNRFVFVPFGAAYGAYSIRPYDWICAILQNADAIPQPGMCGPSKNCPVFISFGAACGAYSMCPYDRARSVL